MNHLILAAKIIKLSNVQILPGHLTTSKLVVQFPNPKSPKMLNYIYMKVWGNLAKEIQYYYAIGDYVIIEGNLNIAKESHIKTYKKTELRVSKIYPFHLVKHNR
uniref:Single-stranded DNA-binding protein n=1 Tax=Gronococcus sybilensis TaxID=3028029 RepID=A0A9Y1I2J2_9RHOD|nr:single-stranded DNA-binding protein [Gronococcus sybilensis]